MQEFFFLKEITFIIKKKEVYKKMKERKIIFEVYDEIDKIAYNLNGIYQTLYSMDLEILTSFVDNQGRASKAFLCDQLSHNISKLIEYNEKLFEVLHNPVFEIPDDIEDAEQSDD